MEAEQLSITLYLIHLDQGYSSYESEAEHDKQFNEKFGNCPFKVEKGSYKDDSTYCYLINSLQPIWATGAEVLQALELKIQFDTSETKTIYINPADIVRKVSSKASGESMVSAPVGRNEYNTKCEVHMPGQALSLYNDMQLLENACTDALQSEIDSGWRIVAACPQPDQRRPDYILGRYNPIKVV